MHGTCIKVKKIKLQLFFLMLSGLCAYFTYTQKKNIKKKQTSML